MTMSLFGEMSRMEPEREELATGAVLLRGFAFLNEGALLESLRDVTRMSPFRHMITPGGHRMSVAMTNCGALGWEIGRAHV